MSDRMSSAACINVIESASMRRKHWNGKKRKISGFDPTHVKPHQVQDSGREDPPPTGELVMRS